MAEILVSDDSLNVIDTFTSFKFHLRYELESSNSERDSQSECKTPFEFILLIEHSEYTDIDAVGLQVWNGALLLADYVIHEGNALFLNKNILELSSGTGFVSIIASIFCKHIVCTDLDDENILSIIQTNFEHNKSLVKAKCTVEKLNFFKEWSDTMIDFIKEGDFVLVSEVIYDNEITDAFVDTVSKIFDLKSSLEIYMTIEKRYVFTLTNLRVEAVHYEYFFRKINDQQLGWKLQKLDIDFPRYFFEYERCKELELWKISSYK